MPVEERRASAISFYYIPKFISFSLRVLSGSSLQAKSIYQCRRARHVQIVKNNGQLVPPHTAWSPNRIRYKMVNTFLRRLEPISLLPLTRGLALRLLYTKFAIHNAYMEML